MWTREEHLDILENLCVTFVFKDDVLKSFEITPLEGYKIYQPGCEFLLELICLPSRYDLTTNPNGYVAVDENFVIPDVDPEE